MFYGESSRGINKRICGHLNNLSYHRLSNCLVVHVERYNHLARLKDVKILQSDLEEGKTVEAAHIIAGLEAVRNHREGLISLSQATARLIISTIGQPISFVNLFPGS